jgi:hypothetical protein
MAKVLRRVFLAGLVALTGCSVFEAPRDHLTVRPGYACTGTVPQCAALELAARELHSADMTARICAAGAMSEACKGR